MFLFRAFLPSQRLYNARLASKQTRHCVNTHSELSRVSASQCIQFILYTTRWTKDNHFVAFGCERVFFFYFTCGLHEHTDRQTQKRSLHFVYIKPTNTNATHCQCASTNILMHVNKWEMLIRVSVNLLLCRLSMSFKYRFASLCISYIWNSNYSIFVRVYAGYYVTRIDNCRRCVCCILGW